MQDFLECVAYGRQPISNFEIASDATKVLYAAYISDSEGRRVHL